MHYIPRLLAHQILRDLRLFPAVAILGARQTGKSTLAKAILESEKNSLYIDLESRHDRARINDPEIFFSENQNRLVCIDEIQLYPELFADLRGILDKNATNGQLLILGSASHTLLKQSSESLAGRIVYHELSPLFWPEVAQDHNFSISDFWLKGGFPRSYLSSTTENGINWCRSFIRTFLERDIPQLGIRIPASTLERLLLMLVHSHGQILNSSRLGESLGLSHTSVRAYIDLLQETFIVRLLKPFEANLKKRLLKTPKVFIRDSGILHSLLDIETFNNLLGHPTYGSSWEGFVVQNLIAAFPEYRSYFYRSASGDEIDLILQKGTRTIAIECKASKSPQIQRGLHNAIRDLEIKEAYIASMVEEPYRISDIITVANPGDIINRIAS